jgi:lipopolysaccharide biosynthesis regulator YciM
MKHLAQFALGAIYGNQGDTARAMEVYKELEKNGAYSKRESHSANHSKAEGQSGGHRSF